MLDMYVKPASCTYMCTNTHIYIYVHIIIDYSYMQLYAYYMQIILNCILKFLCIILILIYHNFDLQ